MIKLEWLLSFLLPLKPRYFSRPAATSCIHHGFRQTSVLETLADSPVVKQTQTTCKPDFRSCIHLQFFWEKIALDSHMKAPGRVPIVMEQSARQQFFGVWFFFFFPLLTLLYSLQIFPALRAPLSTLFQSKLCNSNSSLKKKKSWRD